MAKATKKTTATTETSTPETDSTAEDVAEEVAENAELSDGELTARRGADIEADSSDAFVKVFVLEPGPKPTEANGYDHRANFAATRQYAMQQGLRPTGDVKHVSTKGFGPGGKSWAVTYSVPVIPAERVTDWSEHVGNGVITDNETDENGHVPNASEPSA